MGINKKSQHAKEALIYLNWLAGEKAQVLSANLMPGLYPCANVSTDKIEDALAKGGGLIMQELKEKILQLAGLWKK